MGLEANTVKNPEVGKKKDKSRKKLEGVAPKLCPKKKKKYYNK